MYDYRFVMVSIIICGYHYVILTFLRVYCQNQIICGAYLVKKGFLLSDFESESNNNKKKELGILAAISSPDYEECSFFNRILLNEIAIFKVKFNCMSLTTGPVLREIYYILSCFQCHFKLYQHFRLLFRGGNVFLQYKRTFSQ